MVHIPMHTTEGRSSQPNGMASHGRMEQVLLIEMPWVCTSKALAGLVTWLPTYWFVKADAETSIQHLSVEAYKSAQNPHSLTET
jgi:hypothetical protein